MRYFLDTEFDGFGGRLLSLALVPEYDKNGFGLYLRVPDSDYPSTLWVQDNVWPIMDADMKGEGMLAPRVRAVEPVRHWASIIAGFIMDDSEGVPYIITDWPDDVRYFCQAIVTGPGEMAAIARLQFDVVRVDAYPTTLPGAVQHNAWWDAMALRELFGTRKAKA